MSGTASNGLGSVIYDPSTGKITYTLNGNYQYTAGENRNMAAGADKIIITVTDGNHSYDVELDDIIIDDVPTIKGGEDFSVSSGHDVSGKVDLNFGADGAAGGDWSKGPALEFGGQPVARRHMVDGKMEYTLQGVHTVTVDEDGNYTVKVAPNTPIDQDFNFKFAATDSDGDSTSIDVSVDGTKPEAPMVDIDNHVQVQEKGLVDGSSSHSTEVNLPEGVSIVDADGTIQGKYGSLDYDATLGKRIYTLDRAYNHPERNEADIG